jgi:hypothetical protein
MMPITAHVGWWDMQVGRTDVLTFSEWLRMVGCLVVSDGYMALYLENWIFSLTSLETDEIISEDFFLKCPFHLNYSRSVTGFRLFGAL